jgi:hypothetical protein
VIRLKHGLPRMGADGYRPEAAACVQGCKQLISSLLGRHNGKASVRNMAEIQSLIASTNGRKERAH